MQLINLKKNTHSSFSTDISFDFIRKNIQLAANYAAKVLFHTLEIALNRRNAAEKNLTKNKIISHVNYSFNS